MRCVCVCVHFLCCCCHSQELPLTSLCFLFARCFFSLCSFRLLLCAFFSLCFFPYACFISFYVGLEKRRVFVAFFFLALLRTCPHVHAASPPSRHASLLQKRDEKPRC